MEGSQEPIKTTNFQLAYSPIVVCLLDPHPTFCTYVDNFLIGLDLYIWIHMIMLGIWSTILRQVLSSGISSGE
jgi:hypothetical protein